MSSSCRVSVIILNWNGWKDTIECLESVLGSTFSGYEVILLDNGSTNESVDMIREFCRRTALESSKSSDCEAPIKPVSLLEYDLKEASEGGVSSKEALFSGIPSNQKLKLILADRNYGYAEGNNIAVKYAISSSAPDYILLLNNDTVIDSDTILELVNAMDGDPFAGFAGPKVYYYDYGGRRDVISFAGGRVILSRGLTVHIGVNEKDSGQYDCSTYVDYAEGSCLLVRVSLIQDVGVLDATLFAYWDEVDWCLRGAKLGYKTLYVPKARIWHKVHSSDIGLRSVYYMTRNMFWVVGEYSSAAQYAFFIAHFLFFSLWLKTAVILLRHRNLSEMRVFIRGTWDGIRQRKLRTLHEW